MRSYQFLPPAGELRLTKRPGPPRGVPPAWTARLIALLVGGSGVLNLLSLLGGPVPSGQPAWLLLLFPLDLAGVSRTLTLISGFALVLTALHLWTGKRRAWKIALLLAGVSAAFHLTRSWNVEEAASSAALGLVLWWTRRCFPVGSENPRLAAAALRAGLAFSVAAVYGTAGFWLLEPAEFEHNFHWWDAVVRTLRLMLFLGDQSLVPHTAYAAWFLDSLFWMSGAAILYSGVILFRPVSYRFRVNWTESAFAQNIAQTHGRSGQDFFKHWPDKSYFFSADRQSFLAYRVSGNYALVFGDPVGPPANLESTVLQFMDFCRAHGWRVGFHQVSGDCLPTYEFLGFRHFKVGDDALVDLSRFSLAGSSMKEFRNTVTRLDRLGYTVERVEPPLAEPLLRDLRSISDAWLETPGHRERQFTLGRFERWYLEATPVYVVYDAERQAVAFLNLVPSYNPQLATVDLMRRRPDTVNGLMDYLFAKVFLDLKSRGIGWFSLGMAPLSNLGEPGSLNADERIVHWLMQRVPSLFRADSLRRFKAKYAHDWRPRYAVYQSRFDLPRFGLALRRVSELPEGERAAKPLGEAA